MYYISERSCFVQFKVRYLPTRDPVGPVLEDLYDISTAMSSSDSDKDLLESRLPAFPKYDDSHLPERQRCTTKMRHTALDLQGRLGALGVRVSSHMHARCSCKGQGSAVECRYNVHGTMPVPVKYTP